MIGNRRGIRVQIAEGECAMDRGSDGRGDVAVLARYRSLRRGGTLHEIRDRRGQL